MEILNFLRLVAEELNTIRAKATERELSNLDPNKFHPTRDSNKCIYGQLTGNYTSTRAKEITKKSFDEVRSNFRDEKFKQGTSFTALEKYVSYYRDAHQETRLSSSEILEIMEYLQGKRSSLTLSLQGETYNVSRYSVSNKKGFDIDLVKEIQI